MKIDPLIQDNTSTKSTLPESDLSIYENSSLWLESIIQSSNDAIIGKTLEGKIISWNTGAEKTYGYTTPEMIGQSMLILVPPDRTDEVPEILAKIKKGERVAHFETVRVRKDGTIVDISKSISPIIDKNGTIIGASTIARDITKNKQIQAAIIKKQLN